MTYAPRQSATVPFVPATSFGSQNGPTPPGCIATALSSGVGQLNTRNCPLSMHEADDTSQWFDMLFAPDAQVTW
jgi:hypothetical protein